MSGRLLVVQLAVVMLALATALLAPPREGQMLVVPLMPRSQGATVNWIVAHDGRLIGAARFGGGFVIDGARARLWGAAVAHGALLIGLPDAACGRRSGEKWR